MVTQHIKIFGIEINMKIAATIEIHKYNIFQKGCYEKNEYLILNIWF